MNVLALAATLAVVVSTVLLITKSAVYRSRIPSAGRLPAVHDVYEAAFLTGGPAGRAAAGAAVPEPRPVARKVTAHRSHGSGHARAVLDFTVPPARPSLSASAERHRA